MPQAGTLLLLLLLFLGLVVQTASSQPGPTAQANRCDQKSILIKRTECQSCLLSLDTDCPEGFSKVTKESIGVRDCRYIYQLKGYSTSLPGCRHICRKEYLQPECCPGHWGPDCLECPGGAGNPCSGRGRCAEGIAGNGTCACQTGFGGTACEICSDDNTFGPNCSAVCSCVHGVCNGGIDGDGACQCHSAYTGPLCDKPIPECEALRCPENARCSPSSEGQTKLQCKCLPNYTGDGQHCVPINPCLKPVCHPHARCTQLGPNQHSCMCLEGYHGDGQVCLPVDPCQENLGGCPAQSTVCKYDGPGQSHCECKKHYHGFVPGVGCSMTDICQSHNPCHRNANCSTIAPGQTKCTCLKGYVGNGVTCYGNIMERLRELDVDRKGQWQGRLTFFIYLLDKTYAWHLSNLGPFTLLLPSEKSLRGFNMMLLVDNQATRNFVKLHIIAGQMSTELMNSTDTFYTLTGRSGEISKVDKDSQLQLSLSGGRRKVTILQGDIVASNGLLHILDRPMDELEPTFQSNPQETIMTMLQPRYSKFRSLLEETNVGQALEEEGVGKSYTIFVPSNEALNNMKEGTLDYLRSPEGSRKLLELVRYHIIPLIQLEVTALVSTPHIRSMANQLIKFNITSNGRILANGVAIEETEVVARNGRIYTLSGVLIPPSIVPILPHRCDQVNRKMHMGTCVSCSTMHLSKCPDFAEPLALFNYKCGYISETYRPKRGCARYCNVSVKMPECCKGFYGPDCNQCPGGFSNPCSGNGKCSDGMVGSGTCTCQDGFQGSRCQFCSDPQKYGPQCDKKCLCVHGTCDNSITGDGDCLPGSCREGTAGRLCQKQTTACGPDLQLCHTQATCEYRNGIWSCVCKAGYEGDGSFCRESDPCAGGCGPNAECLRTDVGTLSCVCQQGWTGNGRDCSAINNCLLPGTSGCHDNATCLYVGPGQNECACKEGFRGNGIDCEPITSCLEHAGKCHPLATCRLTSGIWSCVCQEGYEGDGLVCYGNAAVELSFLSSAAIFNQWIHNASLPAMLSATSNLTVLVPSRQAVENMDQAEKDFWLSTGNLAALIKYHVLQGVYRVVDLQALTPPAGTLATSLEGNFLHLEKEGRNVTIGGASIVDGDNVATNGVIHIINKVLIPRRGLTGTLPNLLTRLEQMPDYSIFRGYIIQYNLASTIEAADAYTVFAPSNEAIENYIRDKKLTTVAEDVVKYHVILGETLLKNSLHHGMHRETLLGFSFQLGFFLRSDQLYVNEAPINYTNIATDRGVIHGLGKVLEIQKNRCDINDTTHATGLCNYCYEKPACPYGMQPLGEEKLRCIFTIYVFGRRTPYIGCKPKCVKTVITRECCAGFFGLQCQTCPRNGKDVCFGNGVCLDGVNGTGVCQCEEGFNGTACETCVEGRYGPHCDQVCSCVHGRCHQGPSGDGSCECDVGWRGVSCDSAITSDRCNGTCHTSANCLINPAGTASCRCAAGFQGNGTVCRAINACETSNGGCSAKADCKRTTPGKRVCVCHAGHTGDGIVCLEINPCLENNGGCHKHAECTQTGPNQATCNCLPKYTGDGKVCTLINLCLTKNGGCSEFAVCNHTGLDERTCTCKQGYVGDGLTCRGNIFQELPKKPQTSQYFFQLVEHSFKDLSGPGPFTVFAPLSKAFEEEPLMSDWDKKGVMLQIISYHVVGCHQLLLEDLKVTPSVTSLQGEPLNISVSQDTVILNNKAKIISSDIINSNGVVHIIDKLLAPQNLLAPERDARGTIVWQNLTTVAAKHGYVKFSNLVQETGLLDIISDHIHIPVTLFWPSDRALQALPAEQRDFLFNPVNKDKLKEYLKFHVIRDNQVSAADLPRFSPWKTLQGSELSVKCGTGSHIGDLFLNDQRCRITQRQLLLDVGVAYGIDCLLTDPTLGGHCDTFATHNVSGNCGSCSNPPRCPKWSKPKGILNKCLYDLPIRKNLEGCRHQCTLVVPVPSCCKGYFGPDCQACPGGPEAPCNNRGVCFDRYSFTGECRCDAGFNGTACELCLPGRFGPNCEPCGCSEHGVCDEGIKGSGQCLCQAGWTGRLCDTQTALPPACTPPCSAHATCRENNTCECDLNYEGDGITCTVVNFCKQDNGGCASVAKCSQKNTTVSCSCPKGYKGDGHSCTEIDLCADGLNGGCHEHAICRKTGPGKSKCECKSHYVGTGLDCEPEKLPVDRCLQDNGQCHADANCVDLHFQDTTVGVFHLRSPLGQYKLTFDKAQEACAKEAAAIATYNQLAYAQKAKYHLCSAGWLATGRVAYPTAYSSKSCGAGVVGIIDYGPRINKSERWDVFCYRMKDVNCTCKAGYVGDGSSCSGNLLQVLMSLPSLTHFLTDVLTYSTSSPKGQSFLNRLSNLDIRGTLFVPQNDGLEENATLSGRDIEHHLTNINTLFYNDLVSGTVVKTWLGSQLLITSSQNLSQQETRFVDGQAILQWDIIASNGVIHIIAGPLKAPPAPLSSVHPAVGTGIFIAIFLVIGTTLAAYSYFRLKRRTAIGFQHFESEEDIDVSALGERQPQDNFSNPLYERPGSVVPEPSYEPFVDSEEQQLENSDPLGAL